MQQRADPAVLGERVAGPGEPLHRDRAAAGLDDHQQPRRHRVEQFHLGPGEGVLPPPVEDQQVVDAVVVPRQGQPGGRPEPQLTDEVLLGARGPAASGPVVSGDEGNCRLVALPVRRTSRVVGDGTHPTTKAGSSSGSPHEAVTTRWSFTTRTTLATSIWNTALKVMSVSSTRSSGVPGCPRMVRSRMRRALSWNADWAESIASRSCSRRASSTAWGVPSPPTDAYSAMAVRVALCIPDTPTVRANSP